MRVAFDIDGTLLDDADAPRYDVVALLHSLQALGAEIFIWSGGGIPYAQRWVERLGLNGVKIAAKWSIDVDLAIDDLAGEEAVKLPAKVVFRINNRC